MAVDAVIHFSVALVVSHLGYDRCLSRNLGAFRMAGASGMVVRAFWGAIGQSPVLDRPKDHAAPPIKDPSTASAAGPLTNTVARSGGVD